MKKEQQPIHKARNNHEDPEMYMQGKNIIVFVVLYVVLCVLVNSGVAQQRMYPIPKANLRNSNFDKMLSQGFDIDSAYKFVYLVEPSFSTEYCLTYDSINKSLLLCKSKSKVGIALSKCENKRSRKKRLSTYRLPVDDAYVDSLQSMFCAIINSASPDFRRSGFDGTSFLFFLPSDIYTVADSWCPIDDSNCGRTVLLMERLCKAVENKDGATAEQLREEIHSLTALFRSLPAVYYDH